MTLQDANYWFTVLQTLTIVSHHYSLTYDISYITSLRWLLTVQNISRVCHVFAINSVYSTVCPKEGHVVDSHVHYLFENFLWFAVCSSAIALMLFIFLDMQLNTLSSNFHFCTLLHSKLKAQMESVHHWELEGRRMACMPTSTRWRKECFSSWHQKPLVSAVE